MAGYQLKVIKNCRKFFEMVDKVEKTIRLAYSKEGKGLKKDLSNEIARLLLERKTREEICKELHISPDTFCRYTNPEYIKRKKAPGLLTVLLDYVFDTKQNPEEELSFDEIREKVEKVYEPYGRKITRKRLEKMIDELVKLGIYEKVGEKYKAGMPSIMDGLFEDYLAKP